MDKVCYRCNQVKPLSDFGPHPYSKDKRQYTCRACYKIDRVAKENKNRKYWQNHDPWLKHPTGFKKCNKCKIEQEVSNFARAIVHDDGLQRRCRTCDLQSWQISQYGEFAPTGTKCDICKGIIKVGVDHCHISGKVRGFLCRKCNTGLGLFRDNLFFLQRAKKYLENNLDDIPINLDI